MGDLSANWLEAIREATETSSIRKIAKQLQVSPSALSLLLQGRYPANPDRLQHRIQAWLANGQSDLPPLQNKGVILARLAKRERGQIGVPCELGQVDLVTSKEFVEVRSAHQWTQALRILLFADDFPRKSPRIHLFNSAHLSPPTLEVIAARYQRLNIRLTLEGEKVLS